MALVDNAWYVNFGNGSTTGYYAIAKWTALTSYTAGTIIRQNTTPAVGSERVFICIIAGTSLASEPTWTLTRGAKTAEAGGPTWQECTGIAALNGDLANTPSWTISSTPPGGVKNTAVTLGQVIKRDDLSSYQICTTAGTAGNGAEPTFSNTAGTTTTDNTVTWTSLGAVGDYTGWQAPHARLANAFASTWGKAGNNFFIATEHAETQATAMTLTSPGTLALPCKIYSVTKTTVPPTTANQSVGASISTTGTSSLTCTGVGFEYNHVSFSAGSAASFANLVLSSTSTGFNVFNNCVLELGNTNANSRINLNTTGSGTYVKVENCTFTFGGNTSQTITTNATTCTAEIINCNFTTIATPPTVILTPICANLYIAGTDFSIYGAGKTILGASTAATSRIATLRNCKFGTGVTKVALATSMTQRASIVSSDSSATSYNHENYTFSGQQVVETTIVRTGGASDFTTPIAWKANTNTNTNFIIPYEFTPIAIWNDTISSNVNVTVYGIWDSGALPNNDDIWMDVYYMGDSTSPLSTLNTSNKVSSLATSSSLSSDTSTWGAGSTTPFKMSVTLSSPQPLIKGIIYVKLFAAKASTTFYIDPKPVLS